MGEAAGMDPPLCPVAEGGDEPITLVFPYLDTKPTATFTHHCTWHAFFFTARVSCLPSLLGRKPPHGHETV